MEAKKGSVWGVIKIKKKKEKEKKESLCEVRYEALCSKQGVKDGRKKIILSKTREMKIRYLRCVKCIKDE